MVPTFIYCFLLTWLVREVLGEGDVLDLVHTVVVVVVVVASAVVGSSSSSSSR